MDEASLIRDKSIWQETMRPLLTDYRGGAIFAFTPKGRNWVWELYLMGLDPAYPSWKSFNYPTSANPYIALEEIEEARQSLPERAFRQEYLAEFGDDEGTVFRGVRDASTLELSQPMPRTRYVMGIDWGRDIDFTVATVIDADKMAQVDLIRFNQIGWDIQRGRIKALYDKWKPQICWAEENSIGSVNIEALQKEGLKIKPFLTTAQSKKDIIENLVLSLEQGTLKLLNDPVQIGELQSYNYERMTGGGFRYSAPVGAHDDTVIALAIAVFACHRRNEITYRKIKATW